MFTLYGQKSRKDKNKQIAINKYSLFHLISLDGCGATLTADNVTRARST